MSLTKKQLQDRILELQAELQKQTETMTMTGTIYLLRHKKFKTVDYVGQFRGPASQVKNRMTSHGSDSQTGFKHKVPIYSVLLLQSLCFEYDQEVVEEITYTCPKHKPLTEREKYWQNEYKSIQSVKYQICQKCNHETHQIKSFLKHRNTCFGVNAPGMESDNEELNARSETPAPDVLVSISQ